MIERRCRAMMCAHIVSFTVPAFAQPAWDFDESRLRVFAHASSSGDDCSVFDDGVLLEFPGEPSVNQAAVVGGGDVTSFASVVADFHAGTFTLESTALVQADTAQSCDNAVGAATRADVVAEVGSGKRVVCSDVRFAVDAVLVDAMSYSGSWYRVSTDGEAIAIVDSRVTIDGAVFGRVARPASGAVLIETMVPTRSVAGGDLDAVVNSSTMLRLFTADLVAPFGMLDSTDVSAFIDGYLAADCAFDYDGSGWVDLGDIDQFLRLFAGEPCPEHGVVWLDSSELVRVGSPCSL